MTAAPNKVEFSENLNKVFPKADKFFDNELKNDDINYDELSDVTIPNTQSLFKKLNDGKTPDELKFSSGGNEGANALNFHAMKNVVSLYESNENFWDYLSSGFGREILLKNKMKIHLDSGNIYYNYLNMRESIYDFMIAQQDETKKFAEFNLDINNDFDFYLSEVIIGTTDNKFDIDTHSTSQFLRRDFGEEAYGIRHTIVSDDLHGVEKLQRKNWPYFINRLLEVSDGDIPSFNLINLSRNENDANELEIINDFIENLEIYKSYYSDIYANIYGNFYLIKIHDFQEFISKLFWIYF